MSEISLYISEENDESTGDEEFEESEMTNIISDGTVNTMLLIMIF